MIRHPLVRIVCGTIFLAITASQPAQACGGFFCFQTPIDQSAESIVFSVNPETDEVETHVQISFQGDAEAFAWVVPVPAQPDLFISSDLLFSTLASATAPVFSVRAHDEGICTGYYGYSDYDVTSSGSYGYSYGDTGTFGVVIVAQEQVGPYETVTLQAQSSTALLEWLQDNGYNLPDTLDPVLAPYIDSEAYFVALKLQSDKSDGDIAPLGMRYAANKAGIPIQLTSVAATPDMRLTVYVFGEFRAVPESYLHVRVNNAALNYVERGSNYNEVITRAADEAGGHAFATDFAGSPAGLRGSLNTSRFDTDALAALTDPAAFMNEIINQEFPADDTLLNLLLIHIPMPQEVRDIGVSETAFYNCLDCFSEDLGPFDPVAFAADLQTVIVDPLLNVEELFLSGWLSRMTSSLSPGEMTVDPVFVLNPDMGEVSNLREADLYYLCGDGTDYDDAPRRLELEDGRLLLLPSETWLAENGLTLDEYLNNLTDINAIIIEKTGASGQPEILQDFTDSAAQDDQDNNDWVQEAFGDSSPTTQTLGCSCTTANTGPTGAFWIVLFGWVLAGRRRRIAPV